MKSNIPANWRDAAVPKKLRYLVYFLDMIFNLLGEHHDISEIDEARLES